MKRLVLALVLFASPGLAGLPPSVPPTAGVPKPVTLPRLDLRRLDALDVRNMPMPVVDVAPFTPVAGTSYDYAKPGPLDDAKMQASYLSQGGVALRLPTLRDAVSGSLCWLNHISADGNSNQPSTWTDHLSLSYQRHQYQIIPIVQASFNGFPSGSHEYVLVLDAVATCLDDKGPLGGQLEIYIGATKVPTDKITALPSGVAVRFRYDPTNSGRGNTITISVSPATPASGALYKTYMDFYSIRMLLAK